MGIRVSIVVQYYMCITTSSTLFGLGKSLVGPPRNPCCLEMLDLSSGPPPHQAKMGIIKSSRRFSCFILLYAVIMLSCVHTLRSSWFFSSFFFCRIFLDFLPFLFLSKYKNWVKKYNPKVGQV